MLYLSSCQLGLNLVVTFLLNFFCPLISALNLKRCECFLFHGAPGSLFKGFIPFLRYSLLVPSSLLLVLITGVPMQEQ